jgi:predicted glycogen debranching enzyme
LVAALKPPLDRHVILSHLETTVTSGSRVYRLSTHQFPNMAPTPGYRFLRQFSQDPLPRWQFELGEERLERVLCLARERNVLVIVHTWHGRTPVRLSARPLMPMRPLHELSHEHGGIAHDVSLRPGQVRIRPVSELPPVVFSQPGVFVGSPDWWRRFEYAEDRKRDAKHQEDMWTPGAFEIELLPHEPSYLTVALGELPGETPAEILAHSHGHTLPDVR